MAIFNTVYGGTGGGGGWQPGANTILYYNFENDSGTTVNNQISGGINATSRDALNISTLSTGKKYATFSGTTASNNMPLYTNSAPSFTMNSFTMSCWFKIETAPSSDFIIWFGNWWNSSAANSLCQVGPYSSYTRIQFSLRNSGETSISPYTIPNSKDGNWHCCTCISTSSYTRVVFDGQVIGSGGNGANVANTNTIKFAGAGNSATTSMSLGAIVLDTVGWTDLECVDYYNQTKGDYGIS